MLIKLSRATRYLGALLNVGGSGGAGFIYPDSADRPFATVAARNTWATANRGDLVDGSTVVLVDGSPQTWYLWTGETNPDTVNTALWIDATPLIQGPPGQDGQATDLSGLTDRVVPFNDGGSFADSPFRVLASGQAFIEGITNIEGGTLGLGPFIDISERGGFIGLTNAFGDEFTLVDYRTPQDAPSSRPRILSYIEAENRFDIQTVQTETLTSPITFNYTPTQISRTNALIGQVGADVTGLRFRIANAADTTQVLKYWPSEADWIDGTGGDFAAGEMTLDFDDTELPLNQNTQLQIDIVFDSGSLLGDTNGVPALAAMLQRGQFIDLAYLNDIPAALDGAGVVSLLTALTGADRLPASAIRDLPSPGTPRTDEEIRDVVVAMLTAGANITLTEDDANNTLTIASTASGGGTPPTPISNDLRYGLSTASDPALVDFAALTDVANPTDPQTVDTGLSTAGQYFHIFSANTHDIQTIRDTVLDQIVYQDGASGNIFTKTPDARTEGGVTYDAYTIGPLNAGVDEEYILRFS